RKAAAQGYARAQHSLAFMFRYGRGVRHDYDEAVKWFTKAGQQGFADSIKWLRRAAEQGHAGAQYSLGHLYGTGRGVTQDGAEALKWYAEAAEQGHAGAMSAQARLLATARDDAVRDGKKAVELADRAMRAKRTVDTLDTLAAAYAEVGRFSAAVQMQLQVLEMLRVQGVSAKRVNAYRRRLALYKDKKPYRE
ncbi:MAG: sel1 repeat family protein, partial [Alphaproteobacteria bacterium]|nr:sel1 repeat family protein [Alphaproteobacteria bacterium]